MRDFFVGVSHYTLQAIVGLIAVFSIELAFNHPFAPNYWYTLAVAYIVVRAFIYLYEGQVEKGLTNNKQ